MKNTYRGLIGAACAAFLAAGAACLLPACRRQAEPEVVPPSATNSAPAARVLTAHEQAGGHLLARHVGQTEEQLARRLAAEPNISAASSFTTRETADAAVAATLQSNSGRISSWLAGAGERLVLNHRMGKPVGISLMRGAAHAVSASSVRIVLVRDSALPNGYRILTGYPAP